MGKSPFFMASSDTYQLKEIGGKPVNPMPETSTSSDRPHHRFPVKRWDGDGDGFSLGLPLYLIRKDTVQYRISGSTTLWLHQRQQRGMLPHPVLFRTAQNRRPVPTCKHASRSPFLQSPERRFHPPSDGLFSEKKREQISVVSSQLCHKGHWFCPSNSYGPWPIYLVKMLIVHGQQMVRG
jgi:hypothetical protein